MPWWGSPKILAAGLVLIPLTAFAATEATITFSLGTADHVATILESASVCLTACGGFYVWISKTREARAKAITQEIAVAVAAEKEEREDDVSGLEQAISKLAEDIESLRETSAKADDITNLYRLVEKISDKAELQHAALREQMTSLVGMTQRIAGLVERRVLPREES